jgi:hypothetical protein
MSTVILCAPETLWVRTVSHCPTCARRRRFVGMQQLWYDTVWTCLGCGDSWSGDERRPRPFRRGWRRESVADARARWTEAVRFRGPESNRWLLEQLVADRIGA